MSTPLQAWSPARIAQHTAAIDALLPRYGTARLGPIEPVTASTINENYRVETAVGTLFVRCHQPDATWDAVRLEQRALQWAGECGIPVIPPLAAGDGATIHPCDGGLISIFPWRPWRSFAEPRIGPLAAERLGEMLGRVHRAFAVFEDAALPEQDLCSALD